MFLSYSSGVVVGWLVGFWIYGYPSFIPPSLPPFFLLTTSQALKAGLELNMETKITLNFQSSCHCLQNAGIVGVHHNAWFVWCYGWNPGLCVCQASAPQKLHPRPIFLCLEWHYLGLERWLSGLELLLYSWRTQVQFLVPTSGGSNPGISNSCSRGSDTGLLKILHYVVHINIHAYT